MSLTEENLNLLVEEAEHVRALRGSAGWSIVLRALNERKKEHMESLRVEKDYNTILYHQAYVAVVEGLLHELDAIMREGAEAEKAKAKYFK